MTYIFRGRGLKIDRTSEQLLQKRENAIAFKHRLQPTQKAKEKLGLAP